MQSVRTNHQHTVVYCIVDTERMPRRHGNWLKLVFSKWLSEHLMKTWTIYTSRRILITLEDFTAVLSVFKVLLFDWIVELRKLWSVTLWLSSVPARWTRNNSTGSCHHLAPTQLHAWMLWFRKLNSRAETLYFLQITEPKPAICQCLPHEDLPFFGLFLFRNFGQWKEHVQEFSEWFALEFDIASGGRPTKLWGKIWSYWMQWKGRIQRLFIG